MFGVLVAASPLRTLVKRAVAGRGDAFGAGRLRQGCAVERLCPSS